MLTLHRKGQTNEKEILCVYHEELTKAFGTDAPQYRLDKVMRVLEDAVSDIFIRRGNSTDDEVENLLSLINKIIDVRLKCYDEDTLVDLPNGTQDYIKNVVKDKKSVFLSKKHENHAERF